MNKEQILFKLNAIVRQLTCMNNEEFESHLKDNNFDIIFDHFSFSENSKITTKITMEKKELDIEDEK